MINGDNRDREVNKTLDLLSGIERVQASPFLAGKVMQRFADGRRPPAGVMSRGLRYAIAGMIALVALNVFTLFETPTRAGTQSFVQTAEVDSLAVEYGLTVKEYKDLE